MHRESGRPDSVRLACLAALEGIGPAAKPVALETLLKEFRDDTNSIEVRRALAKAMGELIRGEEIPGEVFLVLKDALGFDDEGVWRAAGYALGKGKLSGSQALQVFQEQRLE